MNDIESLRIAMQNMAAAEGQRAASDFQRDVLEASADDKIKALAHKLEGFRGFGRLNALKCLAAIGRLEGWER